MEVNRKTFGERLKSERKRKGYKQNKVAQMIGVHNSTLNKWESGEREPDAASLIKLSDLYNVTTDYLLCKTDDPTSQRIPISLLRRTGQKSHATNDGSPIKLSENESTMEIQPGTGWNFNNSEKVIHMALEQMNRETVSKVDDDIKMIPVLGTIKAGYDLYAEQQVIDMQPVAASTVSDGAEYFYLLVKGDSMIGEGIREGMRVLVRRQEYVEDGKIGVVLLNGDEATLKRVITRENEILLLSANENYPPRTVPKDYARIQGQVKQVVWDV